MTGFTALNRRLVIWIAAGVFLWGIIHAVGAYLNFKETDNPWRVLRAVIVLLCVEAFLGFWLLMLGLRQLRRGGRWSAGDSTPRDGGNDPMPSPSQRPDERADDRPLLR